MEKMKIYMEIKVSSGWKDIWREWMIIGWSYDEVFLRFSSWLFLCGKWHGMKIEVRVNPVILSRVSCVWFSGCLRDGG